MPTPACSPAANLTRPMLDSYLGKNISEICPHGVDDADLNHCAHFVCHVMNVSAGSVTCSKMSSKRVADRIGACIRVHELFAACPVVGEYDAATAAPQLPARTIGDYLAGFLAAMGDGRNLLSTRCQPASGAARCELWLKHVDDEDKWAWGIAFRLDRRGRPQPSSVECLGAG